MKSPICGHNFPPFYFARFAPTFPVSAPNFRVPFYLALCIKISVGSQKRTLILIQRLAFFLSRKPCPIWLFALCWVQTPLALLSRVGARGVFLCAFQFSWVLRLMAGCKIKRQTCFRFIANLTIVSSINFQNQAHGKSNKLQLTNPGCALVISRQHSSMQAPLCLESDFLHG